MRITRKGILIILTLNFSLLFAQEKEISIKGDKMVISKKGKIVEFYGNVQMEGKNYFLKADYARKGEREITFRGNITLSLKGEEEEKVLISGEEIRYDRKKKEVLLENHPQITYFSSLGQVNLKAGKIKLFPEEGKMQAYEKISLQKEDFRVEGEEVCCEYEKRKMTVLGNPLFCSWGKVKSWGEKLSWDLEKGEVILEGKVKASLPLEKEVRK